MSVIKILWIVTTVGVLLVAGSFGDDMASNRGIFLVIGMSLLAFPSGLLYAVMLNTMLTLLYAGNSYLATPYLFELFLFWMGFFVLGYLQWFKLLPSLRQ